MAKVDRKKATTGLSTFVRTRGLHFNPNGRTTHCKSSPNHLNRRNFQKSLLIGMWGKASFKSIPIQNAPGFSHSRTCLNVSILNLYFLTELFMRFRFKIGLNFPGLLNLGTAKYELMYSPSSGSQALTAPLALRPSASRTKTSKASGDASGLEGILLCLGTLRKGILYPSEITLTTQELAPIFTHSLKQCFSLPPKANA